jgi:hypothetical protein
MKILRLLPLILWGLTAHAQAKVIGTATVKGTASVVGGPPAAGISLVQHHAVTTSSASTTCQVTYTSSTGAGNLLTTEMFTVTGVAPTSVQDNLSNNWTLGAHNSGAKNWVYYYPNSTSGVTTLTFTFAATTYCDMWVQEWSGAATSSPIDQAGYNATGNFTIGPLSSATTNANDLLIGYQWNFSGAVGTITLSGTFASGTNLESLTDSNGYGNAVSYVLVSSTGTYSYTGSDATNAPNDGTIVAIK